MLTTEERNEIERSGREFCGAELKQRGYTVTQMPPENPGFDIEAKLAHETLRIEVKAHRGEAAIIDLTEREWQAYRESKREAAAYRWQLWNVENVAPGAGKVLIKIYDDLPQEALRNASYRVDLRQCAGSFATRS